VVVGGFAVTSEDFRLFLDDLLTYLEAQESGIVQLRAQIKKVLGETKPSAKLPFDASKIKWQDRENQKGRFQVSEDYSNMEHKDLLKFLNEHAGGCMTSEGWFYWLYRNGSTIGRKLKRKGSN
jgi:hypothetical protein